MVVAVPHEVIAENLTVAGVVEDAADEVVVGAEVVREDTKGARLYYTGNRADTNGRLIPILMN